MPSAPRQPKRTDYSASARSNKSKSSAIVSSLALPPPRRIDSRRSIARSIAARTGYTKASTGTSGCSKMSTGSLIGGAAIELKLSMPSSSTAIVSRGDETRCAPVGVRLREPLGVERDGVGDGVEEAELFTDLGFWG